MDNFKEFKIVHRSNSEVWKILKSLKLYKGQLQKYGEFHLQAQLFTETTILGRPENESSEPEQSPGQASLGH